MKFAYRIFDFAGVVQMETTVNQASAVTVGF